MDPLELLAALLSFLAPLAVPPIPPDPALLRAAPADAQVLVQWFGIAEPNPLATHPTERLAAELDVRRMLAGLDQAARGFLASRADSDLWL